MCGRVYVKTTLDGLMRAFADVQRGDADTLANVFPRWNGAPRQDYPLIVAEPDVSGYVFMRANWGFIPRWMKEPDGGRRPINAKAENVASNGMFKHAYSSHRALMPIDGFFEWRDIYGTGKDKQPYAIAMKDGSPFALAAIWEIWRNPATGEDLRTFAIITCAPNPMMAEIHDRMPVIVDPGDYRRWLSDEPDPRDLMRPFPAERMTMWKIGRKVGKVANNTPDILDPVDGEG